MSTVPQWFILILIVNTLLAFLYAVFSLLRKTEKSRSWIIRTIVMLICPVLGVFYFLVSWLLFRLVFRRPVDLSDVVFSKERVESAAKADEELERNFVPLEEAIAVTDKRNLRELMLNIVRGDIQQSLATISLALNSEDSETSHYAASVLQGALNDFRMNVQKDRQMIAERMEEPVDPNAADKENSVEVLTEILLEYINEMLEKKVLTDLEQEHFTRVLDEIGEQLYTRNPKYMDCSLLESLALRLLEIKDYEVSGKWCDRITAEFPETLASYTCRLKLYFSQGRREDFFQVLTELRSSAIIVDRETLDLIRVFS